MPFAMWNPAETAPAAGRAGGRVRPYHSQSYRTVKRLRQFIARGKLQVGDRLPPHQQLAATLGVSNDTLTAAMRDLVAAGVLARRPRAGTVVADLEPLEQLVWSVGIATISPASRGPSSFFTELCVRLQAEVARRSWRCLTYYEFGVRYPMPLSACPPLEEDLAHEVLDGLLLLTTLDDPGWQRLDQLGVAVMHSSFDELAHAGVVIDEEAFGLEACKLLLQQGKQRIAALTGYTNVPENWRLWRGITAAMSQAGRSGQELLWLGPFVSIAGGNSAAQTLLNMPAEERPDALILGDDYTALGLCQQLAQQQGYRPLLVVKSHRQMPMHYPLPVIRFDVDLDELVQRTLAQLQRRLLDPTQARALEWLPPRLVAGGQALSEHPLTLDAPQP